jgi:hypothetical protein
VYIKLLRKLGSGALAPPFCEAKAITSDEFLKNSIGHILAKNSIVTNDKNIQTKNQNISIPTILQHIRRVTKTST